jgi:hypothetical protein
MPGPFDTPVDRILSAESAKMRDVIGDLSLMDVHYLCEMAMSFVDSGNLAKYATFLEEEKQS